MLIAAIRDNTYNVFLLIHVVAFMVAFAPAAINPLLEKFLRENGGEPVVRSWAGFAANFTQKIALPGMGVLFFTGVIMVLLSDSAWEFSQTWVSLAFVLWFAIAGVVSAMILKGERGIANGDPSAASLVATGGKIATLLLVVMLYVMIFKPGL